MIEVKRIAIMAFSFRGHRKPAASRRKTDAGERQGDSTRSSLRSSFFLSTFTFRFRSQMYPVLNPRGDGILVLVLLTFA